MLGVGGEELSIQYVETPSMAIFTVGAILRSLHKNAWNAGFHHTIYGNREGGLGFPVPFSIRDYVIHAYCTKPP